MTKTTVRIPKYDKFKSFDIDKKKRVLQELIKEYPEQTIRETWDLKYGNFYNLLYRLGLRGGKKNKNIDPDNSPTEPSLEGEGDETPKFQETVPKYSEWPRRDMGNIIDAEYTVVGERAGEGNSEGLGASETSTSAEEASQQARAPETFALPAPEEGQPVPMPFPVMKGKVSQLRKQFEAIAAFLEAEGEDVRFSISLNVLQLPEDHK